jgi:4-alpha-glucanotransferase
VELAANAVLPVHWQIIDGDRLIHAGDSGECRWSGPDALAGGVYQLKLEDAAKCSEQTPLIVAPARAFEGAFDRGWLLAVQLYGVRSAQNWGMGDFGDLQRLITLAAGLGASGVGLNPLHALFDDRPQECSPYSPNSRLFLNALYIDVAKLPEFSAADGEVKSTIAELKFGDTISYRAVAELKWRGLRQAFEAFSKKPDRARAAAFEAFRNERGVLLSRFACFETLRHKFGTPWWEWPEPWRQPDDARLAELRTGEHARDIAFVEFVQCCAVGQRAEGLLVQNRTGA